MRILCVADEEEKSLWDYYRPGNLDGIDMIISCGDVSPVYLEFLVTMANCPLVYVRGNHDGKYADRPPGGCICIEDMVYTFRGLRLLGLGGSMKYRPDAENMYTEKEMRKRIRNLQANLLLSGGFDLLVTHAPMRDCGDMDDLPHWGFECFRPLVEKYHPMYMIHGHIHKSYGHFQRTIDLPCGTTILNACGSYFLELPEDSYPDHALTGSPLYSLYLRMKNPDY